jgi:hypothetical protein
VRASKGPSSSLNSSNWAAKAQRARMRSSSNSNWALLGMEQALCMQRSQRQRQVGTLLDSWQRCLAVRWVVNLDLQLKVPFLSLFCSHDPIAASFSRQ